MQQLQQERIRSSVPAYVQKFSLYITPTGSVVLLLGNQWLQVTPQEAREVLEYMLGQAGAFARNGLNGNGASHA